MNNDRTTRYILEAIEDPALEIIILRYKLISSPWYQDSFAKWSILYTVNNEFEIQQHPTWANITMRWNPSPLSQKYAHYISPEAIVAWEIHD